MNPKGLASNRRVKKGGRAAVIPLGEINPPPAPEGRGHGESDQRQRRRSGPSCQELNESSLHLTASLLWRSLFPLYNPPRRPAHSAGPTQKAHADSLEIDQHFEHFLESMFDRFGVVLGCHLGAIFGPFGVQVAPSSVQNLS
jgi:hypothetical protein